MEFRELEAILKKRLAPAETELSSASQEWPSNLTVLTRPLTWLADSLRKRLFGATSQNGSGNPLEDWLDLGAGVIDLAIQSHQHLDRFNPGICAVKRPSLRCTQRIFVSQILDCMAEDLECSSRSRGNRPPRDSLAGSLKALRGGQEIWIWMFCCRQEKCFGWHSVPV